MSQHPILVDGYLPPFALAVTIPWPARASAAIRSRVEFYIKRAAPAIPSNTSSSQQHNNNTTPSSLFTASKQPTNPTNTTSYPPSKQPNTKMSSPINKLTPADMASLIGTHLVSSGTLHTDLQKSPKKDRRPSAASLTPNDMGSLIGTHLVGAGGLHTDLGYKSEKKGTKVTKGTEFTEVPVPVGPAYL
ncbi:hypothetical protein HK097_001418 [Rhizophlyctis rosea]|uniref:Uncharacterized protein n=1 Tax=Rhizophlyctis rosea TaxID=64517 RepID=A0AAD5S6L8_9FUNG|nr:hypothetical protein HK097_001418 [Rhizophlyctis rosea]